MKRISIIIPVYNDEDYIERCVNSIIPQLDEEQDEIILVNDGSTDNTLNILNNLAAAYPLIRIIDKPNEGIAKTRNRGIQESQGEFICFIDNDDYLDPGYIEQYYNAIRSTNADIVIGGYRRIDSKGKVLIDQPGIDSEWYKYMITSPWAKMYRRSLIVDNDISYLDYPLGEDVYFSIKAYSVTTKITVIPFKGYNWFYNDKSVHNTVHKGFDASISIEELMDRLYDLIGREGLMDFYYVKLIIYYLLHSGRTASKGAFIQQYRDAAKWLKDKQIPLYFPLVSSRVKGEPFKNCAIMTAFILICKLGLISPFACIYCKEQHLESGD